MHRTPDTNHALMPSSRICHPIPLFGVLEFILKAELKAQIIESPSAVLGTGRG